MTAVEGTCEERFAGVREAFERNFTDRGELGASVCIHLDGERVVDLWGGIADEASGRPWEEDTVNVLMSCSKGITALAANMLIDRGELDPDKPVSHYWPGFEVNGKADLLVRHVLNHQAGLWAFGEPIDPANGLCDWDTVVGVLERQAPAWEPGTRQAYHGVTIGFLVGELVKRVTGRSIGTFVADEIAGPLGLDLWMGIPPEVEARVAPSIQFDFSSDPELLAKMTDPTSPAAMVFGNSGGWATGWDHPDMHAAELPALGAIGNARALAGMYAPLSLDGAIGDVRLVRPQAIARMRNTLSAQDLDHVLGHSATYTMGFSKSWSWVNPDGTRDGVIMGEDAFGTPGMGGQVGFADQSYKLAFAYTMNRHGPGTSLNDRGQSLIDATYTALGSPGREPGFWIR